MHQHLLLLLLLLLVAAVVASSSSSSFAVVVVTPLEDWNWEGWHRNVVDAVAVVVVVDSS